MTMPSNGFHARLMSAAQAMGLSLDETQCARLLDFLAQMQRWNKTYNLTALRDPEQMLIQHVFDSLSVVAPFARALAAVPNPLLIDVGSGGGLPGVVLAIARPDWQICCVDAVEKKTAFIRQVTGVLGLANLRACHARIETLAPMAGNLIVSRAFASLVDFVTLSGRHAASGASLVAMKGRDPKGEIQALPADGYWRVQNVQTLTVPELDAQRCLVWMTTRQSASLVLQRVSQKGQGTHFHSGFKFLTT